MRKAGLIYSRDTGKSAERSCKAVEGLLSTKRIVPARRSPKEWVLAMDNHNSSEGGETDSDFFKTERKDQDYP